MKTLTTILLLIFVSTVSMGQSSDLENRLTQSKWVLQNEYSYPSDGGPSEMFGFSVSNDSVLSTEYAQITHEFKVVELSMDRLVLTYLNNNFIREQLPRTYVFTSSRDDIKTLKPSDIRDKMLLLGRTDA